MPTFGQSRLAYEVRPVRIYPDDLLHQAQNVLAHLADIDLRYEKAALLARRSGGRHVSTASRERLEQRRRRERRHFEQQLTVIHERVSDIIMTDLRSSDG
jgi:hypothetical protein